MYLTKGERLWLWGRRWSKSREEMAEVYGVDLATISSWYWIGSDDDSVVPEVALKEPIYKWELMAVARRRLGISISGLAKEQGISHVTLIRRERGQGDWMASWDWWYGKIPLPIGGK